MADNTPDDRTPLWAWILIIAALAMLIGVLIKSLSTGGSPNDIVRAPGAPWAEAGRVAHPG
jgi:hypothetical protein